jgi:hypothetical protein
MDKPAPTPPRARSRLARLAAVGVALAVVPAGWLTTHLGAGAAVPPAPTGMQLVFSDDFTGAANTKINAANWKYDLGHGYPGGAPNWGTGEIAEMTDRVENVFLDGNGNLAIKPIKDAAGNWTSGRIETQRTDFAAPAGGKMRIEGRLQQPNVTGPEAAAYWSAFWTLGDAARPVGATNWPGIGEWDIMEAINGRQSTFQTLHCGVAPGGPCNEFTGLGSGEQSIPGSTSSFHTYAVEYDRSTTPEQLRWYVDGRNTFTLKADQMDANTWNNATHHGMFIILNVTLGGGFPGAFGAGLPTAQTKSGVPMLVDYVAVYATGGGTQPNPPTTGAPQPPTTGPTTGAPQPPTTGPTTAAPQPPTTGPTTGAPQPPTSPGNQDAYATIQAESFAAQSGTTLETASDTGAGGNVASLNNTDWLRYDGVNFGSTPARQFVARVSSGVAAGGSGLVEVRLDKPTNPPIGSFAIGNTGGWQSWKTVPANIAATTGTHTVFLTFASGQPKGFVNLNHFTFTR